MSFIGLVLRWAGKPSFHYFKDAWNSAEVCSHELGYTTMEYIRLSGWTFNRQKNSRKERIETCLKLSLPGSKGCRKRRRGLMKKFYSMIQALYRLLSEEDEQRKSVSKLELSVSCFVIP